MCSGNPITSAADTCVELSLHTLMRCVFTGVGSHMRLICGQATRPTHAADMCSSSNRITNSADIRNELYLHMLMKCVITGVCSHMRLICEQAKTFNTCD